MTVALEPKLELEMDENHIVLEDVSWGTYDSLLRDFEVSGQHKRITYNDGRMVIVSPLFKHERWKKLLGRIVEAVTDERNIEIISAGSTTWRQKRKKKGLEPDECFYIQNAHRIGLRLELDLKKDPPPDLAIEVDLRPYLRNKLDVYSGLGIAEVWCFDGVDVEIYVLQGDKTYLKLEKSFAIPGVTSRDLRRFLDQITEMSELALLRDIRKWAKKRSS
jgi:Uma2 family endonuclease